MAQTPADAQHASDTGHHDASRKRQRSLSATALTELPLPVSPPPPMQIAEPGAGAGSLTTDGPSERWQAARQRFAAARWRRGCFHLPHFTAPPPTLAPRATSSSTPKAPRRPHAPPSVSVLGAGTSSSSPTAQGQDTIGVAGAGIITTDQDPAAMTACYVPPNPWKALRSADCCCSPKAASHGPQTPSFLAPPVMVRLDKWNAYWAAYSACCADELEVLATDLREADETAAGCSATAAYRCVNVSLTTLIWSPALPLPPADAAWETAVLPHTTIAAGVISSPSEQRSPSTGSTNSSAPSSSYSYASSYSTVSSSCSSYDDSYTASTRSDSGEGGLLPSADDADARAAAVAPLAPHVLIDLLYHAAHHFGAIEHFTSAASSDIDPAALAPHQWLLCVQFTTATAAGLFWRWVDTVAAADVVEAYRREVAPTKAREAGGIADPLFPSTPSATQPCDDATVWWSSLAMAARRHSMRLEASLVPHDPHYATSELLLGPNVLVSTPLVRSLFEGLFAETRMEYCPALRGFRVRFSSRQECRLALHTLQCSLWRVFGVSLLFT